MKIRTPKNKTANGEGGFTLLETSIALVVMMVGALSMSSLFVFSVQNNVAISSRRVAPLRQWTMGLIVRCSRLSMVIAR